MSDAHQRPDAGDHTRAFVVRGRVQGVGFRWWARALADREGLAGKVWNRRDGAVELHVRGSPDALERLAAELWRGPPAARVDSVEPTSVAELSGSGFEIVSPPPGAAR